MASRFNKLMVCMAVISAIMGQAYASEPFTFDINPAPAMPVRSWIYNQPDTTALEEVEEVQFDEWGFPILWEERRTLPKSAFIPVVFDTYRYADSLTIERPDHGLLPDADAVYGWLDDLEFQQALINNARRQFEINNPKQVKYILANLPEPPKHYHAFVDPVTTQIVLTEEPVPVSANQATDMKLDIREHHWLHTFNSSLQFSQAYVSPNWYQGGNNNLNALTNISWNVKLNEAYHKNMIFETTVQYKLGLNSAPDDSLRNYSISEDLFQINSKFGYRAARRWFYSLTLAFKTQMLTSYKTNTNDMKSAFLSPGELNLGVGMTYDYANAKKTFTFNASVSPLSWNMKTCINPHMDETAFGIRKGHKSVHEFGSSTECTLLWKIAYNISYRSRLFAFTDYEYFQGDWEHTISFDINRFLSTQIYAHMRYDTSTPKQEDNSWHKFQFKEILSFGVSYRFATK